jgi:hypothetical protein
MTGQEGEIYHIPVAHPFNRVNTSEHADGGIGRECCRFVLRSAESTKVRHRSPRTSHRGLPETTVYETVVQRFCH